MDRLGVVVLYDFVASLGKSFGTLDISHLFSTSREKNMNSCQDKTSAAEGKIIYSILNSLYKCQFSHKLFKFLNTVLNFYAKF